MGNFQRSLDSSAWLLEQSHNYPLLTPEQEIIYARHVSEWLKIKEKPKLTRKEQGIARRGKRAFDGFLLRNIRLVVKCAQACQRNAGIMSMDDLVQEGLIGLSSAIYKFDPERGYKFSTYSYWWIRQAINRAIDYYARSVRVPPNGQQSARKAVEYEIAFKAREGRKPTLEEIADGIGVGNSSYLRAYLLHDRDTVSLDSLCRKHNSDPNASTILDMIASDVNNVEEEEDYNTATRDEIAFAMEKLDSNETRVINYRYNIGGGGSKRTNLETSKEVGLHVQSVRDITKRAMRKMRRRVADLRAQDSRRLSQYVQAAHQ